MSRLNSALNLFGAEVKSSSSPIAQETQMTAQPIISTTSPVVANEENAMINEQIANFNVAQIFENARKYEKKARVPSVNLTLEQIEAMSPRNTFAKMLMTGRIGVTRAANATREQGVSVVFANNIEWDQMGRMFAMYDTDVYGINYVEMGDVSYITLKDKRGEQDRIAEGRKAPNGKVYYSVRYAEKKHNDRGELLGLVTGDIHPIGATIAQRVTGYNGWVDAHNAAVKAVAMGIATEEQVKLLGDLLLAGQDPNVFVQNNTLSHINADSIVNKYQLLAWVLLDLTRPAFEIYTRAKSAETFELFLNNGVEKMLKSYRSELKKLAGLVVYQEVEQA